MHGDYSLNPLASRDHVSRVLYQQGRVQLDSDANELTEALLRATRSVAADAFGPHGGLQDSFAVTADDSGFFLNAGHYWVDGILCVNPPGFDAWDVLARGQDLPVRTPLDTQPWVFRPEKRDEVAERERGLYYLDVFEHHVSAAQDDSLRESALLGADTTSRAIVVWQVKKLTADETEKWTSLQNELPTHGIYDSAYLALNVLLRSRARLSARATLVEKTDPCVISPDARYRGADNRLFRVEVHDEERMKDGGKVLHGPTFKFSRDNGGEVYPIREISGNSVKLESLGRDQRTALRVNDWVEVVDDEVLLMGRAHPLRQVVDVNRHAMTVLLDAEPAHDAGSKPERHPILRRWAGPPRKFQRDKWLDLADGVQVRFSFAGNRGKGFRTGDYWLIPTRTATGDVVWPHEENGAARAVAPHGVEHHYAPLDLWEARSSLAPFRRTFVPLTMVQPRTV
jgi:hypothetical protein